MNPSDDGEEILLVDDSPANLRLLSQILGDDGYRVRAVTSGERALASVQVALPDLILLDIRMPGLDGYEVCRRLKADARTAPLPVLFISALDDIEDKMRAFSAGGVDYITKPFQVEEVLARVRTHLSLRRLQRGLQEANQRMERELALAAKVQASFLPGKLPQVPGWQLAVSLLPARRTSGDFYDAVALPGGRLGILIADVVDKGVGAALYMAMSSTLLRASLGEHPDRPDLVCQAVSERLLAYASAGQFVTVFLGILDPASGTLLYSNAGHNPPVWFRGSPAGDLPLLTRTGTALGVMEGLTWELANVRLSAGEALILYTDGVPDAQDPGGEFYRLDRLLGVIRAQAPLLAAAGAHPGRAEALRDAILAGVASFTRGASQADDIALMVLVAE
jgi:phosphoserine phosphatase RsbU/P